MARSLAFETTALAVVCLRDGDQREGLDHGWAALSMAEHLRSARVVDRLTPLADQATSDASAEAIDLAHHITTLQTA
jgi:hypothetical protein